LAQIRLTTYTDKSSIPWSATQSCVKYRGLGWVVRNLNCGNLGGN
jgi:hypothetical protein